MGKTQGEWIMKNRPNRRIARALTTLLLACLAGPLQAQQTPAPQTLTSPLLLPEGARVQGRQAKLVRQPDDDRWFLVFDELDQTLSQAPSEPQPIASQALTTTPETPAAITDEQTTDNTAGETKQRPGPFTVPIEVLPGRWLAAMTSAVGDTTDYSVVFRVWGEITTYRGRNYVLPSYVGTVSLFGQQDGSAGDEGKHGRPAMRSPLEGLPRPGQAAGGDEPQEKPSPAGQPMPDRLREMLQGIPRTRPLGLPASSEISSASPVIGPAEGSAPAGWRGGEMVVDQVGRLQYEGAGGAWEFHFEAGPGKVSKPPLRAHPSRLVEFMESVVGRSLGPVRFRISGQVTQHEGRGYLLLRKSVLMYERDNLGT